MSSVPCVVYLACRATHEKERDRFQRAFRRLGSSALIRKGVVLDAVVNEVNDEQATVSIVGRSRWCMFKQPVVSFLLKAGQIEQSWREKRFSVLRFCCAVHLQSRENCELEADPSLQWRLHAVSSLSPMISAPLQVRDLRNVRSVRCAEDTKLARFHTTVSLSELRVPSFSKIASILAKASANCMVSVQSFPPFLKGGVFAVEGDVLLCRAIGIYSKVMKSLCSEKLPFDFFDNVFCQSTSLRKLLRVASADCETFRLHFLRMDGQATCIFERSRKSGERKVRIQQEDSLFVGAVLKELQSWSLSEVPIAFESPNPTPIRWLSSFFGGGCSVVDSQLRLVVSPELTLSMGFSIHEFLIANGLDGIVPSWMNAPRVETPMPVRVKEVTQFVPMVTPSPKRVLDRSTAVLKKSKRVLDSRFVFPGEEHEPAGLIANRSPEIIEIPRKVRSGKRSFLKEVLHGGRGSMRLSCSNLTGITVVENVDGTTKILWSNSDKLPIHIGCIVGVLKVGMAFSPDVTLRVKCEALQLCSKEFASWRAQADELCLRLFGEDFHLKLEQDSTRSRLHFCSKNVKQCISSNEESCWMTFVGDVRMALEA